MLTLCLLSTFEESLIELISKDIADLLLGQRGFFLSKRIYMNWECQSLDKILLHKGAKPL